jgi:hypothetical protein
MKIQVLTNPKHTVWEAWPEPLTKKNPDIFAASNLKILEETLEINSRLRKPKPKACILWTHEPYFSTETQIKLMIYNTPVYIFNIWNQNALFNNGTFLFQNLLTAPQKPEPYQRWRATGRRGVALMTYPSRQSQIPDTSYRLDVALDAYKRGLIDIYGKGWPAGIAAGNSREGTWWVSKPGILSNYEFNLSFENCCQPYYVTEKLWDSILNGCLPIYRNNGTIYNDFPRGSFLDIEDYTSKEKLWEHIESMSLDEWNRRYGACWDAMDTVWRSPLKAGYWDQSIQAIQRTLATL